MVKRVIIKNGKKYIVNTVGYNDDVGPSAPAGTLWMQSTDGNWYQVTLAGTAISINQTPLTWVSPGQELGYELVQDTISNNVYQVFLTGNAGAVTINTALWPINSDFKPFLSLKSTNGSFYNVNVTGGALVVDVSSKWNPVQPGLPPLVTGYWAVPYSLGW